jgi:hypothetical protein
MKKCKCPCHDHSSDYQSCYGDCCKSPYRDFGNKGKSGKKNDKVLKKKSTKRKSK